MESAVRIVADNEKPGTGLPPVAPAPENSPQPAAVTATQDGIVPVADRRRSSKPYWPEEVTFRSQPAQHVFNGRKQDGAVTRRAFDSVNASLYYAAQILRTAAGDDKANKLETVINKDMTKIIESMSVEQSRLDKLIADNALENRASLAGFTSPLTVVALCSSPKAARYLTMLMMFDRMVGTFYTLWYGSVLTEEAVNKAIKQWMQTLLRMSRRIVNHERQARAEARRMTIAKQAQRKGARTDKTTTGSPLGETVAPTETPATTESTTITAAPANEDTATAGLSSDESNEAVAENDAAIDKPKKRATKKKAAAR